MLAARVTDLQVQNSPDSKMILDIHSSVCFTARSAEFSMKLLRRACGMTGIEKLSQSSIKMGLAALGLLGTLASIISFTQSNPWAGYVLAVVSAIFILAVVAGPIVTVVPKLIRGLRFIVRIADELDERRIAALCTVAAEFETEYLEDLGRRRMDECHEEILDLCRTVDAEIGRIGYLPESQHPKVWTIHALRVVLPLIASLFRKFTGCEVSVALQGRDKNELDKLRTILFMQGVSPRRITEQPFLCKLSGTIPGRVLDNGVGEIHPCVDELAIDGAWRSRPTFFNSMIAWPVFVNTQVLAVLKVDALDRESFRHTRACRLIAELCGRKLTVIFEVARAMERLSAKNNEPNDVSTDAGNFETTK